MKRLLSVKSNRSFAAGTSPAFSFVVNKLSFLVILSGFFIPLSLCGQSFTPFNPAQFGVDGDLSAESRLQGTFPASGSHDWFKQANQTGYGLFDITGASEVKARIASGENYSFSKKMVYRPYSAHNGFLMLDGLYSRDYFGTSSLGSSTDKTAFLNPSDNNKSYANPSTWTTSPLGTSVSAKSDLIDTYIHMRRNGTSISEINPSNLFVYFAATTLSTNGDHYLDFELFKSDITYNAITGLFSNSGPLSTGGHSSWEFNPDGSIKTFGDMSLSFSFNNTTVSEIAIYVWVPYAVYSTLNPTGFDFDRTNGGWAGNSQNSGYGYARIIPNPGKTLQAWGTVNQVATAAPVWGTNSANAGVLANNYYSSQYSEGQLAEAAIDLTSLGIDPALSTDNNRCSPPYIKVLVKSRSSSAFSSTLQDFVTPFAFLNDTHIESSIVLSDPLSCATPTASIKTANPIEGASYHWSTADGQIVSGSNTSEALINQPGIYTLSSAIYAGCPASTTSITVTKDGYQPVAQAGQRGVLTNDPTSYVTLRGGDEAESNYATPFGNSQGLRWHWTGPDGFNSTEQHPKTTKEGTYQLVVTEKRNGCTDTAFVEVVKAVVLPLTLHYFSGKYVDDKVQLQWQVEENESGAVFEIQRSNDGRYFTTVAVLLPSEQAGYATYTHKITEASLHTSHYRLKLVDRENKVTYSRIIRFEKAHNPTTQAYVYQHPTLPHHVLHYQSDSRDLATINVYDASGALLTTLKKQVMRGSNTIPLPIKKSDSLILVEVLSGKQRSITKLIKY